MWVVRGSRCRYRAASLAESPPMTNFGPKCFGCAPVYFGPGKRTARGSALGLWSVRSWCRQPEGSFGKPRGPSLARDSFGEGFADDRLEFVEPSLDSIEPPIEIGFQRCLNTREMRRDIRPECRRVGSRFGRERRLTGAYGAHFALQVGDLLAEQGEIDLVHARHTSTGSVRSSLHGWGMLIIQNCQKGQNETIAQSVTPYISKGIMVGAQGLEPWTR